MRLHFACSGFLKREGDAWRWADRIALSCRLIFASGKRNWATDRRLLWLCIRTEADRSLTGVTEQWEGRHNTAAADDMAAAKPCKLHTENAAGLRAFLA